MNEQGDDASTAALPPERVAQLRDVLAAGENVDEVLISHAMRDLSLVDAQGRGTALNKFLPNERKARAELEKLQRLSSQLADHIEHEMHQSAFCRLWDWPYRQELVEQLRQTAHAATSALARCPSDVPKAP